MRGTALVTFLFFVALSSFASDKALSDLPQKALSKSDITSPGSRPFHLRAHVDEATNADNHGFDAEIDEYWISPEKWRRTIKSNSFSEVLVVNGDKVSDKITGDYYPNWLRTLVSSIFEPGIPLKGIDMGSSSDNPVFGGNQTCRRFAQVVGSPPAVNRVFSSFCFENGLISSIGIPGYHASYSDYRKFGDKRLARRIREYIEPGTELEAQITELTELPSTEDAMFTLENVSAPLRAITVSEETLRKLAISSPEMKWPTVKGGKVQGVLSIYVCIDKTGQVRETYALNSDHPVMSDEARNQLTNWRFKPAVETGVPVQLEGILTFSYQTRLDPENGK